MVRPGARTLLAAAAAGILAGALLASGLAAADAVSGDTGWTTELLATLDLGSDTPRVTVAGPGPDTADLSWRSRTVRIPWTAETDGIWAVDGQ